MPSIRILPAAMAALLVVLVAPSAAHAQLGGFMDKLKRKAEQQVDRQVDKAIDCTVGDPACATEKPKEEPGQPGASAGSSAAGSPGDAVWRDYDYVPGRTVWFSTDFTGDKVGRFPASLEFIKGNAQVVEQGGVRLLEFADYTEFTVNLPESLPPDFSLEVTAQAAAPNLSIDIFFSELKSGVRNYGSNYLRLLRIPGIYSQGNPVASIDSLWKVAEQRVPFRFQADGDYAILYADAERAANMPNARFERTSKIWFKVNANQNRRAYIQFIEVAVGVDELYDSLAKTGEFTTRGILFDFDSDRLRPESTPTLDALYDALAKHGDLAVTIEGHTDDQGEADYNQKLSARRAAAVVAHLTGRGIAASRLAAVGKGESEPAASNATAAGREQNRRVVIRRKP